MVHTIAVVGAGQMGRGIAQTAAQAGLAVVLTDSFPEALQKGMGFIHAQWDKAVSKGKMDGAGRDKARSMLRAASTMAECAGADFVVEAVPEQEGIKKPVLEALGGICTERTILASNTSSISITKMAAWAKRPERFIGMHFMNPVPVMALVEIIRGLDTSDETCALTRGLAERMGKTPVEVTDAPGFVSNRVLMPMINEAIFCLHEGVGKPEAIDTVMKLGMNHPMGPLALADFIGLDTCLFILEVLHKELGDPKYRPCPLLRKMVDAGHLGKKSGRGFYTYPTDGQ
jgi:3-hydroxybutyryl-CoA dehydrogenase